jgi:hypothetical protein
MTMVDGKVLMKDRQLTTIDEHMISEEARKRSKEVWNRYQKMF